MLASEPIFTMLPRPTANMRGELLSQFRILSRDADRASIEMTLSHHDAAQSDQRSRRKSKLFRTQHRGHDNVATGLELPVGFEPHAAAQIVHDEHLVRLGNAQFPRKSRVFDARQWRRARAAFGPRDQDLVRMTFRDTGRDRAHSDFRSEERRVGKDVS